MTMLKQAGIESEYSHLGSGHKRMKEFYKFELRIPPGVKRVVGLIRDPRDTVVSGYHTHFHWSGIFEGSIGEYIRDPRYGIIKNATFNLLLAEYCAENQNAKLITFESLKADAVPVLSSTVGFFGKHLEIAEAETIVNDNTVSRMRARERNGELRSNKGIVPKERGDSSSFKVRKGVSGGYTDELSADDIVYANQTLEALGYFEKIDAFLKR